jgi:hypothetical protein
LNNPLEATVLFGRIAQQADVRPVAPGSAATAGQRQAFREANVPKTLIVVLASFLLLAGLTACGDGDMSSMARVSEDFSHTYSLAEGGEIEVTTRNGTVEVLGWERDQVEITGSKYARSNEDLQSINIRFEASENRLHAKAEFRGAIGGGKGARFVIRAPASARVTAVDTSNGSIRIEGVARVDKLKSSNASISVLRTQGPLVADTSNGSIRVAQTKGDLRLDTSNGRIEADDVAGSVYADTSNANIRVNVVEATPGATMYFDSSNGGIEVAMRTFDNNRMTLDSSNSNITLRLPESVNAELQAKTSNGSIRTDFPLTTGGDSRRPELRGQLGSGGPLIKIATSNGNVRVLRN